MLFSFGGMHAYYWLEHTYQLIQDLTHGANTWAVVIGRLWCLLTLLCLVTTTLKFRRLFPLALAPTGPQWIHLGFYLLIALPFLALTLVSWGFHEMVLTGSTP